MARGVDERPVKSHRTRKSIGAETTFQSNVIDKPEIWQTLLRLSERVHSSMTSKSTKARTITIKVKYADFSQITRSQTVTELIESQEQMQLLLPALLKKTEVGQRPIRLIGIAVSNLELENQATGNQVTIDSEVQPQLGLF